MEMTNPVLNIYISHVCRGPKCLNLSNCMTWSAQNCPTKGVYFATKEYLESVKYFATFFKTLILYLLEDTARYGGLLLAPAEGFGRGLFLPFGQKNNLLCFLANFWQFWCPVVTLVTLKIVQKIPKKIIKKIKKSKRKSEKKIRKTEEKKYKKKQKKNGKIYDWLWCDSSDSS